MSSMFPNIVHHGYTLINRNSQIYGADWEPREISAFNEEERRRITKLKRNPTEKEFILEGVFLNSLLSNTEQRAVNLVLLHKALQKWDQRNYPTRCSNAEIPIATVIMCEKAFRSACLINSTLKCNINVTKMETNGTMPYYRWKSVPNSTDGDVTPSGKPSGKPLGFYCTYCSEENVDEDVTRDNNQEYELHRVLSFTWKSVGQKPRTYRIFMTSEIDAIAGELDVNQPKTVEIKSMMEPTKETAKNLIPFKVLDYYCKVQLSLVDTLLIGRWRDYDIQNCKITYSNIRFQTREAILAELNGYMPFIKIEGAKKHQMTVTEFQRYNFNKIFQLFHYNVEKLNNYPGGLNIKGESSKQCFEALSCNE